MATLQDSNRIMHTRADRFVSMAALKDGIVDGAAQFGLSITASVVDNKVFKKRQECVKVVVKDKRIPDLYITHTSMGTVPYLDMFTVGHRDLMHMAGSMALAGTVDLFRPREIGNGTRALVGGLIGAHGGKKIEREHAVTNDFLDVFMNDVIPYAYQYALNAGMSGGATSEPLAAPGAAPVATAVPAASVDPWDAAEQKAAAAAERERQAREAERERQAQAAAAAAERKRQQQEAERARRAAEQAELERQAKAAAAAEAARQAQEAAAQAERERIAREAAEAERRRKEEAARKAAAAKRAAAQTAEANTLNKLVFITREEARTGCVKTIEVEKGRQVTVTIPAGVSYDSHVELPGEGRMDADVGVRGILRLSFAYSD